MKRKRKTLSSLKKRVKKTATGKYIHRSSGTNHNNGCKSGRRRRSLHVPVSANKTQARRLRKLAPYK
ncbi:MAG: 50S ribosomal protein L35 [candidate division WOR-3 bacterium]|nr:MAG: 50S ribosomal protein L35 [candidate division WOR-3 bacterium]